MPTDSNQSEITTLSASCHQLDANDQAIHHSWLRSWDMTESCETHARAQRVLKPPLSIALLRYSGLLLQLTTNMPPSRDETHLSLCHFGCLETLVPLNCCPQYNLCMFETVIPSFAGSCVEEWSPNTNEAVKTINHLHHHLDNAINNLVIWKDLFRDLIVIWKAHYTHSYTYTHTHTHSHSLP